MLRRLMRWTLVLSCVACVPTHQQQPIGLGQAASWYQYPTGSAIQHVHRSPREPDGVDPCQNFHEYAREKRLSTAVFADVVSPPLNEPARVTLLTLLEQARTAAPASTDPALRALGHFYGSCLSDTSGTATHGAPGDGTRAGHCLTVVDSTVLLRKVLSKAYAEHVLPPPAKAQLRGIIEQIQATAAERLRGMAWVSDSTRQQALTTLATMTLVIGAPETWEEFLGPYTGLTLSPTDFASNRAAIAAFLQSASDGPHRRWGTRLYNFAAYYRPETNTTGISVRVMQPPVFDPSLGSAFNYGAIGMVVSHEIMHAFDGDDGWRKAALRPEEFATFQQLTQRLGAQYQRHDSIGGKTTTYQGRDGHGVSGEHLADVAGLVVAYHAFKRAMQGQPRQSLDGLTPEQRFFVAFANVPRNTSVAAESFRINKLVANMPEFARAFGCKVGDPMALPPDQQVAIY